MTQKFASSNDEAIAHLVLRPGADGADGAAAMSRYIEMVLHGKQGEEMSKKSMVPAIPEVDAVQIIGESVGRISATLAAALPKLSEMDGKRLLRQMMAVVKSEMDFSDK